MKVKLNKPQDIITETLFYNSHYKKLWAYLWLLNCTTQQLNDFIINIKGSLYGFVWALGFLENNFGVDKHLYRFPHAEESFEYEFIDEQDLLEEMQRNPNEN